MLYFRLLLLAVIPPLVSVILYWIDAKTDFGKIPYSRKQIIIGMLFGAIAVCCSEFGVDVGGAVANTRDAAVLAAGMVFGGPAAIIAGIICGVERWFSIYWGGGEFSRIACSVACIFAGFLVAFFRKYIYEHKRPGIFSAAVVAIGVEIFHLGLLFYTQIGNLAEVFRIEKILAIPMISLNAFSIVLTLSLISFEDRRILNRKRVKEKKTISELIQARLLIVVFIAFCFAIVFTYFTENNLGKQYCKDFLQINTSDVRADIEKGIALEEKRHIGDAGAVLVLDGDTVTNLGSEELNSVSVRKMRMIINESEPEQVFKTEIQNVPYFAYYMVCDNGCIVAGFYSEADATFDRDLAIYMNSYMEMIIFFFIYIIIFFIVKALITSNMRKVNRDLNEITKGNLGVKVQVNSNAEFAELSEDINQTVDKMKEYISDAEKRMDSELEFAKHIQLSVLPPVSPKFDKRDAFEIYATMDTAKEVGGDFYDFFDVDEKHVAIVIADVSGKGIPAAMFMMTAKTLINNFVGENLSVDEVFTKANNRLCENNDSDMFVTAWLGIVDTETGEVEYVNAGHNPPVIRHGNGKFEYLKSKPGLVLAGMEDFPYVKQTMKLDPGDIIYLYTDGVTESTDKDGNLYGERRLADILNEIVKINPKTTMKNICEKVRFNMNSFVGDAPQFDDITMLVFKRKK